MPPVSFYFFPFDSGPGAESGENRWGYMMRWMRTTGILSTDTTLNTSTYDLAVTPGSDTDLEIQIAVGQAFVEGFMFVQRDNYAVYALEANTSAYGRIDLVTLELDVDSNIIQYVIVTGTPASSPIAPTPVQNSTIWQMPLATIVVASGSTVITSDNITDLRVLSTQASGGSSPTSLTTVQGCVVTGVETVTIIANSSAVTSQTTMYTVPAGKQFVVDGWGANTSASGFPNVSLLVGISGEYYPLASSQTSAAGFNSSIPYIFDPGQTISYSTVVSTATNIEVRGRLFDTTSGLTTAVLTSLESGNNTLYTCPSGVSALMLYGTVIQNLSGASLTLSSNTVPSGGSVSSDNLTSTLTIANGNSNVLATPANFNTGDFVNITSSATGSVLAYMVVFEF